MKLKLNNNKSKNLFFFLVKERNKRIEKADKYFKIFAYHFKIIIF